MRCATRSTSRALADELGYHRYWVAEHHGGAMLAGPSPEALIGPIAAATAAIRVGSGGVMLPHYSPLKVAETLLRAQRPFPRAHRPRHRPRLGHRPRDDARPPARPPHPGARRLPQQLAELLAYLEDDLPADHPFARLSALPGLPEHRSRGCWGPRRRARSGPRSSAFPTRSPTSSTPAAPSWPRSTASASTTPSAPDAPRAEVAVWALAADDRDEAERLASSSRMAMSLLRRGQPERGPAGRQGAALPRRVRAAGSQGSRAILGAGEEVHAGLEQVAADYHAEEVMIVTITHDHAARRRSYELIAEAFGLTSSARGATATATT